MITCYYEWDMQVMPSNSHTYSPSYTFSSWDISSGMTAAAVQAHAVDESVLADGEGYSVSVQFLFPQRPQRGGNPRIHWSAHQCVTSAA